MTKHVISLGAECDVAHHLRRVFGQETAHYFDWNITPFAALSALIASDLAGAFERENLALQSGGKYVRDATNGVSFWHAFSRGADGRIAEATIAAEYEAARAKVDFLRRRWLDTLASGEPILFVVRHEAAPAEVEALHDLLAARTAGEAHLLAVRRPETVGDFAPRPGLSHAVVLDGPTWIGDAASWDRALRPFALARRPAASAAP